MSNTLLVLDVDGTLANCEHRLPLIDRTDPDKIAFNEPNVVSKDTPYEMAQMQLPMLLKQANNVLVLTGRPHYLAPLTSLWLRVHFPVIGHCVLRTRSRGETDKSEVFKTRFIKNLVKRRWRGTRVICVDDQYKNLEAFAKEGWLALKAPEIWNSIVGGSIRRTPVRW